MTDDSEGYSSDSDKEYERKQKRLKSNRIKRQEAKRYEPRRYSLEQQNFARRFNRGMAFYGGSNA